MKQDINLYQAQFHKIIDWRQLSALLSIALLLVICLGTNFYQITKIDILENKIALNQNLLKDKELSYLALQKNFEQRVIDKRLVDQVSKAKALNIIKYEAISVLAGNDNSNKAGFSVLLQSLGRQKEKVGNIWLTEVNIDNGGFEMRLTGKHSRPELLLDFVKGLGNEELYADREFKQVKINRTEKNNGKIEFVLGTGNTAEDIKSEGYILHKENFMAKINTHKLNNAVNK